MADIKKISDRTRQVFFKKILAVCVVLLLVVGGWWYFIFNFSNNQMNEKKNETIQPRAQVIDGLSADQCDFTFSGNNYDSSVITEISNFETTEDWQGSATYDEKNVYEGDSSLSVVSINHSLASTFLVKNLDLTNMEYLEFMLYVQNRDAFESLNLDLGDEKMDNYYRYSLSNLNNGWNFVVAPKRGFVFYPQSLSGSSVNWSNIKMVRWQVMSRPNAMLLVNFDLLRGINSSVKLVDKWRVTDSSFFSLYGSNSQWRLMARCYNTNIATFKDLGMKKDLMFSAVVSPQYGGRSGLFIRGDYKTGYGYYFLIGGKNQANWQIIKRNKNGWGDPLVKDNFSDISFDPEAKYWLMVKATGDVMTFYFSLDGEKYKYLGEITDSEFGIGGAGIAVLDGGWSLFDDFKFKSL